MEIEDNAHSNFIAECAAAAAGNSRSQKRKEDDCDRVIREAEASKARLFATPGNEQNSLGSLNNWGQYRVTQSAAVDENYMVVGTHVDQSLQQKIINNEYVDFSKLLPRNRGMSSAAEDHRMELVSKGGLTYFMPVSDREVTQISNFSKWEQAFRVFSNVYTRAYPHRASELIQYNHIIHTTASSFIWENVYTYDHEFKVHLSNFPQRSWAVILQQAWTMYLKDKIQWDENRNGAGGGHPKFKSNETCQRYNKGKCNNGAACKYQHKCDECGKFGHGAHICHKKKQSASLATSRPMQETGNKV